MTESQRLGWQGILPAIMLVAIVVALFLSVPSSAWAESIHEGRCGTCNWSIDSKGELTIAPEDGESGTLEETYGTEDVPWYPYRSDIKTVTISSDVRAGESCEGLFSGCFGLTSVDLGGLDTSLVVSASEMFSGCQRLDYVDLSPLDLSKVESASRMFEKCTSLTVVDLGDIDFVSLEYADKMFFGCRSLEEIDFSRFSGGNLGSASSMFEDCVSLSSVDVSGLSFPLLTDASCMFEGCSGLKSVNLSGATFSLLSDMSCMFENCPSLVNANLSNLSIECVRDMYELFLGCKSLSSVSLDSLNCVSASSMSYLFYGCSSLQKVDFSRVRANGVQETDGMFQDCAKLKSVDLSGIDSEISESDSMFGECGKLSAIYDDGGLSFSPSDDDTFWDCPNLRGGNGTAYVDGRNAVKYARIDKPGKPGYFTCKHPSVNKVEVDGSKYGFSSCYKCPTCTKLFSDSSAKREVKPKVRSVSFAKGGLTYSGKPNRPSVKVVDAAGDVLRAGSDYSVSYADNGRDVGSHKVTVRGKGGYSFAKDLSFVVNPKGTSLSEVSKAKKALTAKWKKTSGVNGYQIRYSAKSNMTGAKSTTVKSSKTTSKKVTKLKKKTKYYVQVRTYKVVKGKTYYSGWSKAKSVRTK